MTDSEFIAKIVKIRTNLMALDIQLTSVKALLPTVSKNEKLQNYFAKLSRICTETFELYDEVGPEITRGKPVTWE